MPHIRCSADHAKGSAHSRCRRPSGTNQKPLTINTSFWTAICRRHAAKSSSNCFQGYDMHGQVPKDGTVWALSSEKAYVSLPSLCLFTRLFFSDSRSTAWKLRSTCAKTIFYRGKQDSLNQECVWRKSSQRETRAAQPLQYCLRFNHIH